MASTSVGSSPFNQVFDVVVVGSGHAGYAATVALRRQGRSVLLVGSRGDVVWESGRAFWPDAGGCDDVGWRMLVDAVGQRGGVAGGWMDGAITEVVATDQLLASGAAVLYYAQPVAVERDGDAASSLVVATKSGLRRVAGRQWIDATESGEVLRLLDPALTGRAPRRTCAYMMLQHADWSAVAAVPALRPTAWSSERVLDVEVEHGDAGWREEVLSRLLELEGWIGDEIAHVSMSHLSFEPVAQYDATTANVTENVFNVVSASAAFAASAVSTLADRFMLGVGAALAVGEGDGHEVARDVLTRPLPALKPTRTITADVCVAGAGTGGPLAALASAQVGASVMCVEPQTYVGGIGTGGGIHTYFYGVAGGLQQTVDRRMRALMKRFRSGPLGDGPFSPWAKMIALEQLLREHDVELRTDALLFDVETDSGRVVAANISTPNGVVRVEADAFVDGTGDGDLCALAGAEFTVGREQDAMPHAYTQSSGKLRDLHGRPRMALVNFDTAFCDSTDPYDLTRSRLTGIRQYLLDTYDNFTRPTYIAPALGMRQSRQIATEYVLTLDDQIQRRRFPDPIGYTRANVDNHGTDYEFESDEGLFWVWLNRQWHVPVACEMSYRMLVPRGLANVWIAARCFGVTQDAHYATRQQRDIQRAGEAAGFAAAEAVRHGIAAQQLPYAVLRKWLDRTGALDQPRNFDAGLGAGGDYPGDEDAELAGPDVHSAAAKALEALDDGQTGESTWWLYRHESVVRDAVLERLVSSPPDKPMVGWLAAGVLAMWNHSAAEPRLIQAIESCEYGFGNGYPFVNLGKVSDREPLTYCKVVPNWLCAIALLRRCGTEACLPAFASFLRRPLHGINTLTTVAITLKRLATRGAVTSDRSLNIIEEILDRIPTVEVIGSLDLPPRDVGRYSELALRGEPDITASVNPFVPCPPGSPEIIRNGYVDNTWQLHLAVAGARAAFGLPIQEAIRDYLHDDRAVVRRAFSALGVPD